MPIPNKTSKEKTDKEKLLLSLLAECALKKETALDQLYSTMSSHLFALIIRIVTRRDWAEEILQETFIKIWTNADRYNRGKGHPVTWMVSIARNRSIDWLRASERRELSGDVLDIENTLSDTDIENELLNQQVANEIIACLDELDNKQKDAIAMAYYQGYTHKELAIVLKTPLGTVKSWIRRGLEQLKRCLSNET